MSDNIDEILETKNELNQKVSNGSFKNFLNFDLLITVKFIKLIYIIGSIALIIVSFVVSESMFRGDEEEFLGGLFFALLSLFAFRLICEGLIVKFQMSENLSKLVNKENEQ